MKIMNRLFTDMKVDNNKIAQLNRQIDSNKEVTKFSREEEKINEIFKKNNQVLTKDKLDEVKIFLSKTEGSLESKLETIDTSLSKGIEITADNLSAVHEALVGDGENTINQIKSKPLEINKVYEALPKELKVIVDNKVSEGMDLKDAVNEVLKQAIKNVFTSEAVLETGSEKLDIVKIFSEAKQEYLDKLPTKGYEANKNLGVDKSNVVKDSEIILKETVNTSEKSEKEVKGYNEIQDIESDLEVIETIEKALERVEEDIDTIFSKIDESINVDTLIDFQADNTFKNIMRTEITEKMSELKDEFTNYKTAIVKQLDNILIKAPSEKALVLEMKETITSVIDKLDHILMKSEITMHTDMKTERDLLASSSKLEEARVLLDKNDSKAAVDIVRTVKTLIERVEFKPSDQKMFGISQKMFVEKLYDENIIKTIPININSDPKVSPRAVLELFRDMGLNHESEVSEILNKQKNDDGLKYNHNMKSILMKLSEDVTQKVSVRDDIDNLLGQQLMNKLEYKSQKQKLLFNMPIQIDNGVKNLKIHVNAKKDNQKIDWKNSTLYFVVKLDNLGDTGILVDINNGRVNLTIKNDSANIEEKIQPYLKDAIDRFEEIGLSHFALNYDSLTKEKKENSKVVKSPIKEIKKEGFDFKI